MDDKELQAALEPLKTKVQGLDQKARRRTLEQALGVLGDASADKPQVPVRPRKLRSFSGSREVKAGEVDFATWRLYALPIVKDSVLKESEKQRVICESLLSPALEVACSLGFDSSAEDILEILEQHYGTVEDGYELYTQFRSAVQSMQETTSDYLHRLHMLALRAVDRKGLEAAKVPLEVLRQFENNCADDDLLTKIGVRDMLKSPPTVAELLLKVRTEESRRRDKKLRLKARTARANVVSATESNMTSEMESLKQEMAALRQQMSSLAIVAQQHMQPQQAGPSASADSGQHGRGRGRGRGNQPAGSSYRGRGGRGATASRKSRFGFCFNCGDDGHFQRDCTAQKNPERVHALLLSGVSPPPSASSEN